MLLKAGHRTSLQLHNCRTEKWIILKGCALVILDGTHHLKEGDEIRIPKTKMHRLEAVTDLKILEISYGLFDELDIIRFEDDYDRV